MRIAGRCALAVLVASLILGVSCRSKKDDSLVLKDSVYGFFLGQTKGEVFKSANGIATITRAPESPYDYRGELWNFSAPIEPHADVERVRCAFFKNRLMEVIVYYRDTDLSNLEWLKLQIEGQYRAHGVAEDPEHEMAQKTYRFTGEDIHGMSITLRRITKKDGIELYVQFLHDELTKELIEKNKERQKK